MQSISAKSDTFTRGQCTDWASFRYHQLTGYYPPWSGDAYQWAGNAAKYGWINSVLPVMPSIICLQPGVQGADGSAGHVAVVEKINSDGTVTCSNLNWGLSIAARSKTSTVTFRPGAGVSFIYAVDANGQAMASNGAQKPTSNALASKIQALPGNIAPNAEVAAYLYGADVALQLQNPFDTSNMQLSDITIAGIDVGPNPVAYAADVMTNMVQDMSALIVRTAFIVVGLMVMWFVTQSILSSRISEGLDSVGGVQGVAQIAGALV